MAAVSKNNTVLASSKDNRWPVHFISTHAMRCKQQTEWRPLLYSVQSRPPLVQPKNIFGGMNRNRERERETGPFIAAVRSRNSVAVSQLFSFIPKWNRRVSIHSLFSISFSLSRAESGNLRPTIIARITSLESTICPPYDYYVRLFIQFSFTNKEGSFWRPASLSRTTGAIALKRLVGGRVH